MAADDLPPRLADSGGATSWTYRMAPAWTAFWVIAGASFFAVGGYVALLAPSQELAPHDRWLAVLMSAVGLLCGLLPFGQRCTRDASGIETSTFGRRRRLSSTEIDGYWRTADTLRLIDVHGRTRLSLSYFRFDETFEHWLAGFPDLKARHAQQVLEQALRVAERVAPLSEGKATLQRTHRIARTLAIVAVGLCVWGLFYPRPYTFVLLLLMAVPPLAMALLIHGQGLYVFGEQKGPCGDVALPVILSSGTLMVRALKDYCLVNGVFAPGVFLCGIALTILIVLLRRRFKREETFLLLIYSFAYSQGVLVPLNCLADRGHEVVYTPRVLSKRMLRNHGASHELMLEPWGARTEPQEVAVAREIYSAVEPGDAVAVHLLPGALGWEWFFVSPRKTGAH